MTFKNKITAIISKCRKLIAENYCCTSPSYPSLLALSGHPSPVSAPRTHELSAMSHELPPSPVSRPRSPRDIFPLTA